MLDGCSTCDRHHPGQRAPGHADASSSRFDPDTGILTPTGNPTSKDAKLSRTREFITGVQHELIPNLAVGVDYVYRNYDRGTAGYTAGYQPGAAQFPLSAIYVGPINYTDPVTGIQAPYLPDLPGLRPAVANTGNRDDHQPLAYNMYQAVIPTLNKRFSNRWQMNASATFQTNPNHQPLGSYVNPTGIQFTDSRSTIARYLVRVSGTYAHGVGHHRLGQPDRQRRREPHGLVNGSGRRVWRRHRHDRRAATNLLRLRHA